MFQRNQDARMKMKNDSWKDLKVDTATRQRPPVLPLEWNDINNISSSNRSVVVATMANGRENSVSAKVSAIIRT